MWLVRARQAAPAVATLRRHQRAPPSARHAARAARPLAGRRSPSPSPAAHLRRRGVAQLAGVKPRPVACAAEGEEGAELSLEEDFNALSDDVARLAADCVLKLDGVSLFLVGMMGSGKSTVGQLLAKTLKYCFFDSDDLIEQLSGKKIPEIFEEEGEAAFRELETQVGSRTIAPPPSPPTRTFAICCCGVLKRTT